jgi:hypothetical protein
MDTDHWILLKPELPFADRIALNPRHMEFFMRKRSSFKRDLREIILCSLISNAAIL